MRTHVGLKIAVVAGMAAAVGRAGAQQYAVADLGTLGGPAAFGFAVNSAGHAAGASARADASFHGLYFSGSAQELVPLAGDTQCWPMAMNSADAVAAISFSLGALVPHGLLWQNGSVTGLGALSPRALNALGTVVGYTNIADTALGRVDHAASWRSGVLTDLGTLGGGSSYAGGIDGSGRVVGWSFTPHDLAVHGALWLPGATATDLGTLGGNGSQAYAINDAGVVVGMSQTPAGAWHAVWVTIDAGGGVTARTDLGTLAGATTSAAYSVNAAGVAVGTSGSRAFVWSAGVMTDLNTLIPAGSGWVLERAWSVSDTGNIVGSGLYLGQPRAFLLTTGCYANCDGSTAAPILNVADFTCFLGKYAAGDGYANCDGSTSVPALNVVDFTCFLQKYASGCP